MSQKKDTAYIQARDSLIPQAERYANEQVGAHSKEKNNDKWSADWSRVFHSKMNQLAKEAGLV